MKTITPSGNELIVAPFRFQSSRDRDDWHNHAFGDVLFGIYETNLGKYLFAVKFFLVSGGTWYYVIDGIGDSNHAVKMRERLQQFLIPPDNYPAVGEAWNFWERPLVSDKIAGSDWSSFLASH